MGSRKCLGKLLFCISILLSCLVIICSCEDKSVDSEENQYKIRDASRQVYVFKEAIQQYYLDTQKIPERLIDLVEQPQDTSGWTRYLNSTSIPKDPWGNDYVYEPSDGFYFDVICYGADGKKGGDGVDEDIRAGVSVR